MKSITSVPTTHFPYQMNRYIASLIIFCLLLFAAQGEAVAQKAVKKHEELNFSCLYWEGVPAEDLYYRDGKSFHLLEFKNASRSKSFGLKRAEFFELYREAVVPVEGMTPYDLLSQTEIPLSRKILFLVIPFEREGGIQYKVIAMDDSLKSFPPGSFRFANFCREMLFVRCGEQVEEIPAREMTVVQPKDSLNGGFVPFMIGNAKGETLFKTQIDGQPSGRELVLITPSAKPEGRPRVKFVSQLIVPSVPLIRE